MTPRSRFFLRLRRGLLRCYEAAMFLVLLGMAAAALWPASARAAQPPQCGKIQSSTVVMPR